jgi:hypothetical protein
MMLDHISAGTLKLKPVLFLFIISFSVLSDGTLTVLRQMPGIQSFAWKNAFSPELSREEEFRKNQAFVTSSFPRKDTVIILSRNYESFYYAAGAYYNPVNVPSSTEMFYKRELDSLTAGIKKRKYAVLFDSMLCVDGSEMIIKSLKENAYVSKRNSSGSLIIFRPKK